MDMHYLSYFDKKKTNIDCGTRSNRLSEAVLMNIHNLCFEQEYEKYQIFLSENFPFLVVKNSIYLNRRGFVNVKAVFRDCDISLVSSLICLYIFVINLSYSRGEFLNFCRNYDFMYFIFPENKQKIGFEISCEFAPEMSDPIF